MDNDVENIVFSLDTLYFRSPSHKVSLMISMNSFLFKKVVPGFSTTASINSRPSILDLIVKVFMLWFGISFKHNLHMLLNTVNASVKYLLASSVLWKLGRPSIYGA